MSYSLKAASLRWDFWKHGKRSKNSPDWLRDPCKTTVLRLGFPQRSVCRKHFGQSSWISLCFFQSLAGENCSRQWWITEWYTKKWKKNHIRWPARIRFGLQDSQDSKLGTFGWRNVLETMHTILGAWNHLVPTFLETSWNREVVPESISLQDFHQLFEKSQQSTQFIRLVQKVFHTSRHNKTVGV